MKRLLICLLLLAAFSSCEKQIEQMKQNAVIDAMTNGTWQMVVFKDGTEDKTGSFSPYTFKFNTNYTVDAINNGSVETSGTWSADPTAKTISSQFQNASNPLPLLNGTWKIVKNSWTYVEANMEVGGTTRFLRLEKL